MKSIDDTSNFDEFPESELDSSKLSQEMIFCLNLVKKRLSNTVELVAATKCPDISHKNIYMYQACMHVLTLFVMRQTFEVFQRVTHSAPWIYMCRC